MERSTFGGWCRFGGEGLVLMGWGSGLRVPGVTDLVILVGENLDVAVVHVHRVDVIQGFCDLIHPDHLPFTDRNDFSIQKVQIPGWVGFEMGLWGLRVMCTLDN